MRHKGEQGEDAARRIAEECEQEEAERLARHIGSQALTQIDAPTLQVERNWNLIRWAEDDSQM